MWKFVIIVIIVFLIFSRYKNDKLRLTNNDILKGGLNLVRKLATKMKENKIISLLAFLFIVFIFFNKKDNSDSPNINYAKKNYNGTNQTLSSNKSTPNKQKEESLPKYRYDKEGSSQGESITTYRVTILANIVSRNQLVMLATKLREEDNSRFVNIHFYSNSADKYGMAQFSVLYGVEDLSFDKDIHGNKCEITDNTEINRNYKYPYFEIK